MRYFAEPLDGADLVQRAQVGGEATMDAQNLKERNWQRFEEDVCVCACVGWLVVHWSDRVNVGYR